MNLAVPLNMFYGCLSLLTHYTKTMNLTQTHIIHTYNSKVYKYADTHLRKKTSGYFVTNTKEMTWCLKEVC